MKNKVMKIYCFILTFLIILMFSTITFAEDSESIEGIESNMSAVSDIGKGSKQAGKIGTGIKTILGIKYLAAGPSEKVDVKKQMLPFLIGSILLFSAARVVDYIYKLAQDL